MKVYRSFEEYKKPEFPVITIGFFDGVHIGHQKIIKRLNTLAEDHNGESVLLTFWPHPRLVLQPDDNKLRLINTLNEKLELLEQYGLDNIVVVPFTKEFSRLSPVEYIRDVLVNTLGGKTLIIEYDHRFGKNRCGSFDDLKEAAPTYDFQLQKIDAQEIEDVTVSSTKIRKAVSEGDMKQAQKYLGHSFSLSGDVVKGDQIGRTLGFPTANIKVPEAYKLLPGDGVYAVRVKLDDRLLNGMLNIGNRPTISKNGEKRIEVHLFDFDEDIYNRPLKIEFVDWLREDIQYNSLDELVEQLKKDAAQARLLLSA